MNKSPKAFCAQRFDKVLTATVSYLSCRSFLHAKFLQKRHVHLIIAMPIFLPSAHPVKQISHLSSFVIAMWSVHFHFDFLSCSLPILNRSFTLNYFICHIHLQIDILRLSLSSFQLTLCFLGFVPVYHDIGVFYVKKLNFCSFVLLYGGTINMRIRKLLLSISWVLA